jgi:hypothetical protein
VETLTVVPSSSTAILSKENDQHVGRFFLYYFFFVCVCFFFFFEFL